MPADVIGLDIGFQYKNYPFTVGDSYKPLDQFIRRMSDIDFKTVVITDLHIAKNPAIGPYSSGHDKGYFLKDKNGAEYSAKVWPEDVDSVFPDFTRKPVRDWWGSLYKEFYVDFNVGGFWNDMSEPVIFEAGAGAPMPNDNIQEIEEPGFMRRSMTHAEGRNVLGMQNGRGTYDGMLALKSNQRPFVMTRASYAGGQRYAVTWTGDNVASWEHLRIATNQIASLGLAGFHSSADIGGYHGVPSSLLLTHWIQIGSFYPISRDHTEGGKPPQEPWANGTQADFDLRAKYIRNRYALMPYYYSLAEETSRTGTPILRRMFLEFPNAKAPDNPNVPIDVAGETQFLVGPSVLVAPSPVEQGFVPQGNILGTLAEAERMSLSGGATVATDHTGYTGTGFVAGLNSSNSPKITFKVSGVTTAGQYALQMRYASHDAGDGQLVNRTMTVLVDGVAAGQATFAPSGSWDTWSVASKTLQLGAGDHEIVVIRNASDSGRINIDSMAVTTVGAAYPTAAPPATGFDVLLPPGKWYDYGSGSLLPEPSGGTASSWKYRVATAAPTELPVFVRAGSIIPRVPAAALSAIKSTVDVAKISELELSVYPGDDCKGTIYVDDGTSFAYKNGAYYRRNYTCTANGGTVSVRFGAVEGNFRPSWNTVKVVAYTGANPVSKVVNENAGQRNVTLP